MTTTHHVAAGPARSLARPGLPIPAKVCLVALALLGLGALAGGIALVAAPDGSVMHLDLGLLGGSPFADYMVPGLLLGVLFGVGSFVVVALGLRHAAVAPFLAFAIGVAQMVWITVELAIIRELSFLHPVCFGLGLVIAVSAVPWGWPTFQGWRERRGS